MNNYFFLFYSLLPSLIGFIIILIFILTLLLNINEHNYLKKLKKKLNEFDIDLSFDRKSSVFRNLNNQFQTLNQSTSNGFLVTGLINSNYFEYYEVKHLFKSYSFVTIEADTYKPNFSQILIKKQKNIKNKNDFDLEWNDFNITFDNRFKNPKQALEVVTPTFMEKLFGLANKYKEIRFEYFETTDFQKHTLALIIYPKLTSRNKKLVQRDTDKIIELVKDLIILKNNI